MDEKRQPVDGAVLDGAVRNNVLVLRAWDLYGLVALRLAGGTAGRDAFIDALKAGGGWLEADTDAGVRLRTA